MIELKNINKTYKNRGEERKALKNITVKFPSKGLFSVVGKSGSGKSTLINVIAGLDSPDSGQVLYNGEDINDIKKLTIYRNFYVGMIFQDFHLIEDLTVYENVKLALDLQNQVNGSEKVDEVLEKLAILNLKNSYVNELSGGEKQRVAIARAIVKGARILLADEPTGNLDRDNALKIYAILRDLSEDMLVILITHDEVNSLKFCDHQFKIRDGSIEEHDSYTVNEDNESFVGLDLSKKEGKIVSLSNKLVLKRKGRLIFTVILSIIAISLFAFAINLKMLEPETMYYNTLSSETYNDFYVRYETEDELLGIQNALNDMSSIEYSTFYRNNFYILDFFGLNGTIDSVNSNFSRFYSETFSFISTSETNDTYLSSGEIGITDYLAMSILHYSNLDVNEVDDLIGQNININGYDFVIGHIVDTDYEEYLYLVNDSFNYYDNDELEFKVKHQYTTVYMLPSDFESSKISQRVSTVMINDTEVEIYNASVFNPGWLDQDFPTETNEIALSYGYIINNNLVNDNNYASIIGGTLNINYFDEDTGIFTKSYLIVGTYDSYLNDIVLSETEYYNVANDYGIDSQPNSEYIHFQIGNESETKEVVKYLYDSNLLTQNIAWDGYQFSQQFSNDIAIISLIVGLILFILAAGMIGHFITIFIIDNKEITGILLALGASKQKIYKLYLWRSLIQIIVVVVTVIPILFLANGAMNNFILQFDTGIKIFYVNYVAVIMVFILCFILYFSCTLIPLSKFFKKDINNLIYNRV